MTQPNQTTPTALSTGPWTIPVCDRCGYVLIPTAVSGWCHCAENREAVVLGAKHGTYSEVEVIPLSTLSRLVEELEARADDSHANGNATEDSPDA